MLIPRSQGDRQRNLLGLRVEDWKMIELVDVLDRAVRERQSLHVWGICVVQFALVKEYPEIVDFSQRFDIMTADGAGIPFFGRLMGQKIREHVGLPYVSEEMIRLAARKGYRLLLFGATPEVNAEAARRLKRQYPALRLLPGIHGYYEPEQEREIAEKIRRLKPDILLVGITFPKKERFVLKWKEYLGVPVSVACGGYFDVLAGKTTLAPKWVERLAMSWFWRFVQEPKRLFKRMLVNPLIFLLYIFPVSFFAQFWASPGWLHIDHLMNVKRPRV